MFLKVLQKLSTNPLIVAPFMIGLTILLGLWTFNTWPAIILLVALGLIGISFGTCGTKVLTGNIINEINHEAAMAERLAKEQKMRGLTTSLSNDKTLRPLLEQLQEAKERISEIEIPSLGLSETTIRNGFDVLFNSSINLIIECRDLRYKNSRPDRVKDILTEVKKNVKTLNQAVEELRNLSGPEESEHTRNSLTESIEIAKKVNERITGMNLQESITELKSLKGQRRMGYAQSNRTPFRSDLVNLNGAG
jgi:hypothetical protein